MFSRHDKLAVSGEGILPLIISPFIGSSDCFFCSVIFYSCFFLPPLFLFFLILIFLSLPLIFHYLLTHTVKPIRSQQQLLIYFQQCNQWVSNHQIVLQWLWGGSRCVSSWKSDLWPAGWCWTNKTVMSKQEISEQWRLTHYLCVEIVTINGWSVIIIQGLLFSCCLWHRARRVECANIKFVHVNGLDISLSSETGSISAAAPFRAAVARCGAPCCLNDPSDNPWNPQNSLKTGTASGVII